MISMLCYSTEHDMYIAHPDEFDSKQSQNLMWRASIMQYPLNAGSGRSVGTEPADILLEKASLPTMMCNSDLIIYMFSLNKKPT